jgi:hypothetical protein
MRIAEDAEGRIDGAIFYSYKHGRFNLNQDIT